MTTIDRMLFRSYLRAYLICVVSLLSLYIIIDLFTNLDDFAQEGKSLSEVISHILTYYMYQSLQIFNRLCEAIVMLAAMFTVAWLQRNNELLPLLSAGVSTHRVLRPILCGSALMLGMGIANQELLIPRVADQLMANRDDPVGDKQTEVRGAFDSTGIHVEGLAAYRRDQSAKFFYVTIPETATERMVHLTAEEARYIPPQEGERYSGGWLLTGTTPAEVEGWSESSLLELIDSGKYFLRTEDITFETVVRNRNWYTLLSTAELYQMLNDPEARRLPQVAVQFHMRLTRFAVGLILVVMGLALILRDQNRHVFISAGMCLAMCALFYAVIFACKHLGDSDLIAPALAAWLPVMIFGPAAVALLDGVHT